MRYLIPFAALVGSILLYLLSSSNANTAVSSAGYYALLGLTGFLALALASLVGYQLLRLRSKLRHKVFGARLTLRLVVFFTLIAVLPGVLIYAVSAQFLNKSIESWFDVRVEKALEGGLNLGRSALDNGLKDLVQKAHLASSLLVDKSPAQYQQILDWLTNKQAAQEIVLFSARGNLVAFSSMVSALPPDLPDDDMLRVALTRGEHAVIDTPHDKGLRLRALVTVAQKNPAGERYVLQFTQPAPKQVEEDAETVQAVYRDYQGLTISRLGLKRMYAITLTLSLLIVLLTAVSAAFFISERLGASLESLAEGTRAVAQGDFSGQQPIRSRDELGALTGLFNQMTRQLAEARTASEQQQRQVESAKGYLESVLTNLSSGVLGFDGEFRLRSANPSAAQILGAPLQDMQRMELEQIAEKYGLLNSFCRTIKEAFQESDSDDWQRQIERLSRNGNQILLMRGTRLPPESGAGYVVVFDDISHLLQAERQAAWGEVARRLAHEIKNPLTPIQLSAERLQHKLSNSLDEEGQQLLQRATQTIVNQVAAMKNMVGDFADYARGPALRLAQLEMHALIREVLGLYEANRIPIKLKLDAPRDRVNGDATRLRQVIHNLLQNAQDALQGSSNPLILLCSAVHNGEFLLSAEDNGGGFSESALTRAFEPYMTTKSKGTGLGLAIVKKIVEEHGGSIAIENIAGGARVSIALPLLEENA